MNKNYDSDATWSDALYLSSANPKHLDQYCRPAWWNPKRVIAISNRIESDQRYSAALRSCLSMVRPDLFAESNSLVCGIDCEHFSDSHHRACCHVRDLVDIAVCDDALRIVIDELPYRLMHECGQWFVIGLKTVDAELTHPKEQPLQLIAVQRNGELRHRIDQQLPLLSIADVGAIPWMLGAVSSSSKRSRTDVSDRVVVAAHGDRK